jgi:hypothetical protein
MAHLVSSDRGRLVEAGSRLGLGGAGLQYKPLRHPDSGTLVEAWHWDLRGPYLEKGIRLAGPRRPARAPT